VLHEGSCTASAVHKNGMTVLCIGEVISFRLVILFQCSKFRTIQVA